MSEQPKLPAGGPGTPEPGGQPTRPPARSERPRPADDEMAQVRARLRLFLLLVVGLIVLMTQQLPFRLAGIPLAVAALWVGVRQIGLLRRLRRSGKRSPGVFTLIIGLGLAGMLLFLLIADAVYYPLVSDLENCEAGANTQQASDLCQRDAKDRINDLIQRFSRESSTP